MSRPSKDQLLFDLHNHCINLALREIYIHSYYGREDEEAGVEFRLATTYIKNLHVLDQPPSKPILVHLHSIGGCWNNGMAIFNSTQFSQSEITMLAYSQASSMSGIIFQSADLRIMMPDCHFLMHHGSTGGWIDHPFAVKSSADFEMKVCKRMLQIFAERAIIGPFFKKKKSSTVETAYRFFDKKLKDEVDWIIDADEAKFYGLCDDVLGSNEHPDVHSLRPE